MPHPHLHDLCGLQQPQQWGREFISEVDTYEVNSTILNGRKKLNRGRVFMLTMLAYT
jgi:hypothetical protein